jgi:hypothetical protein
MQKNAMTNLIETFIGKTRLTSQNIQATRFIIESSFNFGNAGSWKVGFSK